jgi:hypothetical protein
MLKQAPTWLITYWENREQMFFKSMHCLFLMIANKQHAQPQKTEEDNHVHHGRNKSKKEKGTKKEGTYLHPRVRTNKPTTEQQRGAKGRGKAE